MCFSVSYNSLIKKIKDLSLYILLIAIIFTTISNIIANYKDYFKEDNFKERFGLIIKRCKKDYKIIR
jgi:uncharacterized protein YutD